MSRIALPQLAGYDLVERIGTGAGAIITLAREKLSRRPVAIKHVVCRQPEDIRFIKQAETEYEVGSRCEHPYLRKCYEIIRTKRWLKTKELFLIMEFVEGAPLEEQCPEELSDILPLFIKIAEGLQALHGFGYAHADIKPHNILITRDGGVKIIDFGQSCSLGHKKDRVQGTPDYMAPEQVQRRKIDHRTDLFSLGATMYWVLTGKYFRTSISTAPTGTKVVDIEARRASEPPIELNPEVPLALSNLIMECCAPEREHRPADMREFISRIELVQHLLARRAAGNEPSNK